MRAKDDSRSLANIIDTINELEWRSKFLMNGQRLEKVRLLASFFNNGSDYLGFEIPDADFEQGARLFTGERIRTRFGLNYVLSLEACRAMILMDGFQVEVATIIDEVNRRVETTCFGKNDCIMGECAFAALAYWRFLLVTGWGGIEDKLHRFIQQVQADRDGSGRWLHFPFYFTLQVLHETRLPEAQKEIAYAQPACERSLPFVSLPEPYASRRKSLLANTIFPLITEEAHMLPLGI